MTEALDLTTPAGRAMAGLLAVFADSNGRSWVKELGLAWLMRGRTGNGWVGRQPRPHTLRKSGNSIAPVLANPRSHVECRSGAPRSAES